MNTKRNQLISKSLIRIWLSLIGVLKKQAFKDVTFLLVLKQLRKTCHNILESADKSGIIGHDDYMQIVRQNRITSKGTFQFLFK